MSSDMLVGITEARVVGDMVAALREVSSACSCMVYDHNDPRWITFRHLIDMTTDTVSKTVVIPSISAMQVQP